MAPLFVVAGSSSSVAVTVRIVVDTAVVSARV
jgi:hypothetical protein